MDLSDGKRRFGKSSLFKAGPGKRRHDIFDPIPLSVTFYHTFYYTLEKDVPVIHLTPPPQRLLQLFIFIMNIKCK
jgi:hypothetical protein